MLLNFLDTDLYERQGKAVTNFVLTLCESSYAGQLGTYVVAVNHQIKMDEDKPTVGLLVCKDMDKEACLQ